MGQATTRAAGPEGLLLFERWMETTRWLLGRTQRFPKPLRHTLTERIEMLALGILEDVTSAAYRKPRSRILARADDRLDRLRVLLRLAHELDVLPHAHYEEAAARLAEAGRLLGGWRRSDAGGGSCTPADGAA